MGIGNDESHVFVLYFQNGFFIVQFEHLGCESIHFRHDEPLMKIGNRHTGQSVVSSLQEIHFIAVIRSGWMR